MRTLIAAALLLGAGQASATKVEVATGDWSNIPHLKTRSFNIINGEAVDRVHRSFQKGECVIAGQSKNRLNLNVPFLIQFGEGGAIERLVLRKIGCPSVETVLASTLLQQAQSGEYKGTGVNEAGWYQSELRLTSH